MPSLQVKVLGAKAPEAKGYFVKLQVGDSKTIVKTAKCPTKTGTPTWDETFTLNAPNAEQDYLSLCTFGPRSL